MIASHACDRAGRGRSAFTLVELLITISIVAIMATMVLFALYSAQQSAKEAKTRALITKLDAIIKNKWEAYRTRRVPIAFAPVYDQLYQDSSGPAGMPDGVWDNGEPFTDNNGNGKWDPGEPYQDKNGNGQWDPPAAIAHAVLRLNALHDLMRMELPDRWSDIATVDASASPFQVATNSTMAPFGAAVPSSGVPPSSVWQGYFRKVYTANQKNLSYPSLDYQGAECLYMIVMSALAEEGDAREVFKPDDVKDVDGDGFPEFVDAWGQPIRFLRWAPGFQLSDLQIQVRGLANFHSTAGAFIGGALVAPLNPSDPSSSFNISSMQRITKNDGNGASAFGTGIPFTSFVTAPDPFDSLGVGSVGAVPTFAIYPFIYSAGPDKAYGIVSDGNPPIGAKTSTNAAAPNLNPFCLISPPSLPQELIGNARQLSGEPDKAWLDNIHNHVLSTR